MQNLASAPCSAYNIDLSSSNSWRCSPALAAPQSEVANQLCATAAKFACQFLLNSIDWDGTQVLVSIIWTLLDSLHIRSWSAKWFCWNLAHLHTNLWARTCLGASAKNHLKLEKVLEVRARWAFYFLSLLSSTCLILWTRDSAKSWYILGAQHCICSPYNVWVRIDLWLRYIFKGLRNMKFRMGPSYFLGRGPAISSANSRERVSTCCPRTCQQLFNEDLGVGSFKWKPN